MVVQKITRREMLALWEILKMLSPEKFSLKFSYAISKTASKLETEIKAFQEAVQAIPEKAKAFEDARQELAKAHAVTDDKGNPKQITDSNGNKVWDIPPDNILAFQADLDRLKETMAEEWEAIQARQKELEDMLDEEVEVKFHRVHEKYWPAEIEPAFLNALEPMFAEDGEDLEKPPKD